MRKVIEASKGHILTNGKTFGRKIYLAEGSNSEDFYEITLEKYNEILAVEPETEEADIEDYKETLSRLGVSEDE